MIHLQISSLICHVPSGENICWHWICCGKHEVNSLWVMVALCHSCASVCPRSVEWRTREEARPHFLFPLRRFSLLSFTNCDPINNNWSLIEQHPDVRILFMALQSAKGSLSALSTDTVRIQRWLHAHCIWRQEKDRGSRWEWSSIYKNGI